MTAITLLLLGIFIGFWLWYGGNGKPMSATELQALLAQLELVDTSEHGKAALAQVRELMASDDGKEFYMQNLVRYRPKALYPPGYHYGDDPRAADQRYAKAIWWHLLKHGNVICFVARRTGNFVVPEGADSWHYVALVRYRSRRDFLRFAIVSSSADNFVHKWAAIEKTHIFPVKPVISLFMLRGVLGLVLLGVGLGLHLVLS